MLLGEDAEELTTNSVVFSDVSADRWSAGYIGYCAQQGILAGTGNGAFDPEGELTGLAFAKMCLVALGYNADSEGYVGTDWAINVAADAVNAGISPSGLVLANVISREDAAQMAFQTLEADMVTYNRQRLHLRHHSRRQLRGHHRRRRHHRRRPGRRLPWLF